MNAKEKSIAFFMKEEASLSNNDDEKRYPLQLDKTIDIAIKESKKELYLNILKAKFNGNVREMLIWLGGNFLEDEDIIIEVVK